eukprot:21254_4
MAMMLMMIMVMMIIIMLMRVRTAWIQQHTRMIADGMKAIGVMPEDYFILPRHAWVGTWQHSAALWSGDIISTFDELKMQVNSSRFALCGERITRMPQREREGGRLSETQRDRGRAGAYRCRGRVRLTRYPPARTGHHRTRHHDERPRPLDHRHRRLP